VNVQPQADMPLVLGAGPTPEPPDIHTLAGQLAVMRAWVRQYENGCWPEVVAAKAMTVLLTSPPRFDLEECRADVRRIIEILQAFGGRLACLDAQVNGLPEV
jgi:hypothetical protein